LLFLETSANNPRHFKILGSFEFLHEVLEFRSLDESGQLVEALGTALYLVRGVADVQIVQKEGAHLSALVLEEKVLFGGVYSGGCLERLAELTHF
jgi:hypothetical protein